MAGELLDDPKTTWRKAIAGTTRIAFNAGNYGANHHCRLARKSLMGSEGSPAGPVHCSRVAIAFFDGDCDQTIQHIDNVHQKWRLSFEVGEAAEKAESNCHRVLQL